MKTSAFLGCFALAFSALQAAEPFVTPDFVKQLESLEAVKKEAADSNKGVTFLLMEPGST